MRKLVIVESPAKAKTIARLLGPAYTVRASLGHVRDLPEKDLGVDIEHAFKPTYHLLRRKAKTLQSLRTALDNADELFLATDPDREGEAIAWHLLQALKPRVPVRRVTFHEITAAAVQAAFAQPRSLNMELVNAQQARRVLDRLVGYQVSPLLWKSTGGQSAGRVQSVALRLVVEREREIAAFVPVEYWSIVADLAKMPDHRQHFLARLVQIGKRKVGLNQAIHLKTKADAEQVTADLQGAVYHVLDIQRTRKTRQPHAPFTTSTLQQAASARLHLAPADTMRIAQELYEGLDIGEGKAAGLITYMRTDSTAVAPEAQAAARQWIEANLGAQYLPATAPRYASKVKNAQEAHEAIRPTEVPREPLALKPYLSERQFQVYDLIWRRFVASQMAAAQYTLTTVDVQATVAAKPPYLFRALGRVLLFDGFLKVWQEPEEKRADEDEPQNLPELALREALDLLALRPRQHFTQPPPRYSESSLIKALEERGIGRPSTYASIINTLKDRAYVSSEKRILQPTVLGEATCDALLLCFQTVMDYGFTAQVEDWLDDISRGEREWTAALEAFYTPFAQALSEAPHKLQAVPRVPGAPRAPARGRGKRPRRRTRRAAAPEVNHDLHCPQCKSPMVKRQSKHGAFWGCTRYPDCKGTRKL